MDDLEKMGLINNGLPAFATDKHTHVNADAAYECISGIDRPEDHEKFYWKWLASTKDLQEKTYHYNFESDHFNLPNYLLWNMFATYQELAEAAVEFSWKPWAVDEPFVNTGRVISELIDASHFIGNMLVGMGVTDEEYEALYRRKQDKNRRRAASGTYSAKKGTLGEGSDAE